MVLTNPTDHAVTESVMIANPHLMDDTPVVDVLNAGGQAMGAIVAGFATFTVPPKTTLVLQRDLGMLYQLFQYINALATQVFSGGWEAGLNTCIQSPDFYALES